MKFRRTIAGIMAVLTIAMCCAACGSIDEESSSSKKAARRSSKRTTVSDSEDEAETRAAKRSSEKSRAAKVEEETETGSAETTEAETETASAEPAEEVTEAERSTIAKRERTAAVTTQTATAAVATTENNFVREFQECFPDDENAPDIYYPDIDELDIPGAVSDDPGYVSSYETKRFFWLDVEKEIDYVFNGRFIKISLKVKDDTPAGCYPISIKPDVSNVNGICLNRDIKALNGEIAVGKPCAEPNEIADAPVIYADNITAKPGETVDYYICFANNPGIAAFLLNISYDSNAFDWISTETCGEFADIPSALVMRSSDD